MKKVVFLSQCQIADFWDGAEDLETVLCRMKDGLEFRITEDEEELRALKSDIEELEKLLYVTVIS